MIETHILEIRMPESTEYLGFESEEKARGTAFDALQHGILSCPDESEIRIPQGTMFRVIEKNTHTIDRMFARG